MKKETTEQRIERVRAAALSLASERDINEISILDVAKEAAISSSTIYHHFPNIEALICDLMDEIFKDFTEVLRGAVIPEKVNSWHDINRMIETSFVDYYQKTPLVQNILFGHHSYMTIREADAVNDILLGDMVAEIYKEFFILPTLPTSVNIFAVALQVADKVYSMDYRHTGSISAEMASEAVLVTESYLGAYLPRFMPRVEF